MTLVQEAIMDEATGVEAADTARGLVAIRKPGAAAAIWRRPAPGFLPWIETLEPEALPSARVILRPKEVRVVLRDICEASGTPSGDERTGLIDDAAALSDLFADVMETPYLRLRFDVLTDNACRLFHIDAVTARLICTYRGTGTQYGVSADGDAPRRVFTVPTGAPIILRGTRWPQRPQSGLVHRSPPIEGSGETRLLFVLDPIRDPDKEV